MCNKYRWIRTFPAASSFFDDLGCLGTSVGPRTGVHSGTQGQKEDYVLRRLLVAEYRREKLNFPFEVCASDQMPEVPDFVIADASRRFWGLEVTEAGSEYYQASLTHCAEQLGTRPTRDDLIPFDCGLTEIRNAIKRKNNKYDKGAYRNVTECDLAVYDNTNSYSISHDLIESINNPDLRGRFREVYFVRDRQVYAGVLSKRPVSVNVSSDFAE